jgi:hypothetical protein
VVDRDVEGPQHGIDGAAPEEVGARAVEGPDRANPSTPKTMWTALCRPDTAKTPIRIATSLI